MEATLMKVLGVISTTAVFLLLGAAVPAFAQEEHHEEAAKPATHEEAAKPAKQEEDTKAKPVKQEKQAKPAEHEKQAKSENQEGRGNTAAKEHGQPQRSAEAQQRQRSQPALRLSARSSARIPDDRFRANFGSEHVFVINEPVLVGGFSRFQYGGFWFGF